MLSIDGIVLADESRDSRNAKLQRWWEALEFKASKICITKKEYTNCNFSKDVQRDETPVRIGGCLT